MPDDKRLIEEIRENCIECGLCLEGCLIMSELEEMPAQLALREISAEEAYSCCLCGLCEAVCPEGLQPIALFRNGRCQAVQTGAIDVREFSYLMPDRPNGQSAYRAYQNITYDDLLAVNEIATTAFFPGCTMLTYAPELLRTTMDALTETCGPLQLLTECCGHPLRQMGLNRRATNYEQMVCRKMKERGVKDLIIACPNCYYTLRALLADSGIRLHTIFDRLPAGVPAGSTTTCIIHDVCPDRFDGIFKEQMSTALKQAGYTIKEPSNSGNASRCCGSGGQVSHHRPDFREKLLAERLATAEAAGGDLLVCPCMSCVLNLSEKSAELPVYHGLNLLLNEKSDYSDVKKRAAAMFETAAGLAIWEEAMAAPDPDENGKGKHDG